MLKSAYTEHTSLLLTRNGLFVFYAGLSFLVNSTKHECIGFELSKSLCSNWQFPSMVVHTCCLIQYTQMIILRTNPLSGKHNVYATNKGLLAS